MNTICIKNNQIEYNSANMSLVHLGSKSTLRLFKRKLVAPHTVIMANNIGLGEIFLDNIIGQSCAAKNFLRGYKTVERILASMITSTPAIDSVTMVFLADEDCMILHRGITWFVSKKDLSDGFEFDVTSSDIITQLLNSEQQMIRNILKEASSNGICQTSRNSF